jgi:hypothetical protein
MYCLCVNVYCHRVSTQLQLTNISISISTFWPSAILLFQLSCGENEVMSWPQEVFVSCLAEPVAWPLPRSYSQTFVGFWTRAIISYLDCDSGDFYATSTTHSLLFLRTDINDFPAFIKHCPSQVHKGLLLRVRGLFVTPTFGHIPQWQNLSPQGLVVQVSYTPFLYIPCAIWFVIVWVRI